MSQAFTAQDQVAITETLALHHTGEASRSCCVCKKELTDAASVETGIGPICRKRANESLARTITPNIHEAKSLCYIARDKGLLGTIPQIQATLDAVVDSIIMDPEAATRRDWRETVNRVSWLLSHDHLGGKLKCLLHDITEALGYVATVAMWRGEVVMGKCQVVFDPDTRTITTHSPRPGSEVREAMKGAGFRYNPSDKSWFAPVVNLQYLASVERCITTHFLAADLAPFTQARDWLNQNAHKALPTPARPQSPALRLVRSGVDTITVHAPYNQAFVASIKAQIPAYARTWSGADKVWLIHLEYQATLLSIVSSVYGYNGGVETT